MKNLLLFITCFIFLCCSAAAETSDSLWDMAQENKETLKISTIFSAWSILDRLNTDKGIDEAVDWCKKTGVTHVFLEYCRNHRVVEKADLESLKARFVNEGFEVSGCISPTGMGKPSASGRRAVDRFSETPNCYTSVETQGKLQEIFEYLASVFDEIIIDDWFFTDCECDLCIRARGEKRWERYRRDLMTDFSREYIIKPARAVNPDVTMIIKYPNWYDNYHNRGYDVERQTALFDKIWVGTETREPDNERWGSKVQYAGYFIMRWLGDVGGSKTGGGWFDPLGTTPHTYLEQAYQTILGGAQEITLCCYGVLQEEYGPSDVEMFRTELKSLYELAGLVRDKTVKGILMPKPLNSDGYEEQYLCDFVGMMGLPLVPSGKIEVDAGAAFFSVHALNDPYFPEKLKRMLQDGKPVLITDGLAKRLSNVDLENENLMVLQVNGDPHRLLKFSREELNTIRNKMLAPLGIQFDAPNKVGLYLLGWDVMVIENFNDEPVDVTIDTRFTTEAIVKVVLPVDGEVDYEFTRRKLIFHNISPRTLVALSY